MLVIHDISGSDLLEFNQMGLELSRSLDHDLGGSLPRAGPDALDLLDDVHSINDRAEDDMLSVQPLRLHRTEEKLRTIGVWPSVGHRQNARSRMLELKVFVFEFVAVDRFATRPVVVCKIATLAHKLLNDTVEGRSGVSESLFAGAEGAEVFSSAGDNVGAQLHYDATGVISTNGDVEKDFGQGHSVRQSKSDSKMG